MAGARPPPRRAAPSGIETVAARRPLRSESAESEDSNSRDARPHAGSNAINESNESDDDNENNESNQRHGQTTRAPQQKKRTRGGGNGGSRRNNNSQMEHEASAESLFPALEVDDVADTIEVEGGEGADADGDADGDDHDDDHDDHDRRSDRYSDDDSRHSDEDSDSPSSAKRRRVEAEPVRTTRSGKAYLGVESVVSKVRTAIRKAEVPPPPPPPRRTASRSSSRSTTTAATAPQPTTAAAAAPARRTNPARATRQTAPMPAQSSPVRGRKRARKEATPAVLPQTDGPADTPEAAPGSGRRSERGGSSGSRPGGDSRSDRGSDRGSNRGSKPRSRSRSEPGRKMRKRSMSRGSAPSEYVQGDDRGDRNDDYSIHVDDSSYDEQRLPQAVCLPTKAVTGMARLMQTSGWTGKRMWKTAFQWQYESGELGIEPTVPQCRELWYRMLRLANVYAASQRHLSFVKPLRESIGESIRLLCETMSPLRATATQETEPSPTAVALWARQRAAIAEDLAAYLIPQAVVLLEHRFVYCRFDQANRVVEDYFVVKDDDDGDDDDDIFLGGRLEETCPLFEDLSDRKFVIRPLSWLVALEEALAREGYRGEQDDTAAASRRQLRPLICRVQDMLCRAEIAFGRRQRPCLEPHPLTLTADETAAETAVEAVAETVVEAVAETVAETVVEAVVVDESVSEAEDDKAGGNGAGTQIEETGPASSDPSPRRAAREPTLEPTRDPSPEPTPSRQTPAAEAHVVYTNAVDDDDDEEEDDDEPMMTSALAPGPEFEPVRSAPQRVFTRDECKRVLSFLTRTGGRGDLTALAADLGCAVLDVARQAEEIKGAARRLAMQQQRPVPQWSRAGY